MEEAESARSDDSRRAHRTGAHTDRSPRLTLRKSLENATCLREASRVRGGSEHDRDEIPAALTHQRGHAISRLADVAGLAALDVELVIARETVRVHQVVHAAARAVRVFGLARDAGDEL